MHRASVVGRVRSDPGLLLLMTLVVALTTALTTAVEPLTARTADRAVAATVRDAGERGAVVATLPDGEQPETRDPLALVEFQQDGEYALATLPDRLAAVLSPGVATLSTPSLQLLDAGPGRYLRLAYAETPDGPPPVEYVAGGPPRATTGPERSPWPLQVALSESAAGALGLGPGDQVEAEDEQRRSVLLVVSGVYAAADPGDEVWRTLPELLEASQGVSEGSPRTSATALVGADSLPDLRFGVPADDLTHRVTFTPRPERLRWRQADALGRDVVALQASAGLARGAVSWSSLLDRVLDDGLAQIATARGQAQVLLIGLLSVALLVLLLAAGLLVRRRAGPLALARERGATLLGLGVELAVESATIALVGAALGLGATVLLTGGAGWWWVLPIVVVTTLAAPVLGAGQAARATDTRRVPANRAARRTAVRRRRLRRLALDLGVLAAAGLTLTALHQRGAVGGPSASSAPLFWTLAGGLVLLRVLPPAVGLLVRSARRSPGQVRFLTAAGIAETGLRALPVLVVVLAAAQLVLGLSLAATGSSAQEAAARTAVGGDARLTTVAGPVPDEVVAEVSGEPGVRAAVAARVADGVRATSRTQADSARVVVVDVADWARLWPGVPRVPASSAGGTPALLVGGDPGLDEDLRIRWDDETTLSLDVVGRAPRVGTGTDPVVVVDRAAFPVDPDTVWATGPGAAAALRAAAPAGSTVTTYAAVLAARQDAPLAAGLRHLAYATSLLLLLLAALGVLLGAATEAPARAVSLGRLRSLGLRERELRVVLTGELLGPALVAAGVGLALGVTAALVTLGPLDAGPRTVVPLAAGLALVGPVLAALVVAVVEARRLRRTSLARLLRGG